MKGSAEMKLTDDTSFMRRGRSLSTGDVLGSHVATRKKATTC